MTHGSNTSNHHPLQPRDDRETLSALFDGELPGDAARFALKRLDHDAGWRETCGRWLLIGDALRGEATSAAPVDFSAAVMRRLAAEGLTAVAASPAAPVREAAPAVAATRRRWLGSAAIAASVAVAAVLVTRPFSPPVPMQTQAAAEVITPAVAPERVAQESETRAPAATSTASPTSAATIAVVDTPAPQRARRASVARKGRTSVDEAIPAVAAAETTVSSKPFHPPADEIVTRPWPRAVLPATGGETFAAGFGATSAPASSFYPFEPRLPEAATKSATTESQH